jgi:hypothetical protein
LDSSAAINYRPVAVPVAIAVVIFLDDHRVSIPMLVAITDNRTVVISITVAVVPRADRYANRSDTNSYLFGARRHCSANARDSGNYQSVFHLVLLTL